MKAETTSTLDQYHKRRDFARTREPRGEQASKSDGNKGVAAAAFVVQKHAARHLHYDFRLELNGVLMSWAVPKGPSIDPSVRRLAVEVEPHPVEYGDFEGLIAEKQYGAGAVMVWDRGTWQALDDDPQAALGRGRLSFRLNGQKLKGTWHLVRTRKGKTPTQWLLFKSQDEHAQKGAGDILERQPNSVLTGRSIEEIAATNEPARVEPHKPTAASRAESSVKPRVPASPERIHAEHRDALEVLIPSGVLPNVSRAKRRALPDSVDVQLAQLADVAPEGEQWLHEIKFDGYRVLVRTSSESVQLLTRKGLDWTHKMPALAEAFRALSLGDAILDGEFVALDETGVSHFQMLQNSLSSKDDSALVYYAFDLLYYNGFDLAQVPLVERKALLSQVLTQKLWNQSHDMTSRIRLSEHVRGSGKRFFEQACRMGLEGVVCKRAHGVHVKGRSGEWLKVKCTQRQEFVIVGYTEPAGSRSKFGALLLGVYDNDDLRYCGRVGTGFSERSLHELHAKLTKLGVSAVELKNPPTGAQARGVHWVTPSLVAQVAFTGFTQDGVLRHPSFEGLREDKKASDVVREVSTHSQASVAAKEVVKRDAGSPNFTISNPDKVLYPERNLTKRQLLEHAALVARFMLPHVVNRPLTLVRCPNGAHKHCFFQKHLGDTKMPGLHSVGIREKEGKADYTVVYDEQGLYALVQLGVLEIHTSGAMATDYEHPNSLVFDLDPDVDVEFARVMDCAKRLREIFYTANLESFVKTTGGKGLHVCVPVEPTLEWDEAKAFTRRIAEALVKESPDLYVATQSKAQRKGKIYIDYLRNGRGATFIAPYSTRARANAPVATPLFWDELTPGLLPDAFTLENLPERLSQISGDPFARMAELRQRLPGTRGN